MTARRDIWRASAGLAAILALTIPVAADWGVGQPVGNAGSVFGLTSGPGELVLADAGQGIVRLRNEKTELVAALPGVTDVEVVNPNLMFAITGSASPTPAIVWRVQDGVASVLADLGAYE